MIKTEFSRVNDLFLTYPKGFYDANDNLISFYQKLIGIIPENIRQFIVVNNEDAGKEIKALYPKKNIVVILINGFKELWLRDIMGFNSGINKIYRPIYNPTYCNYVYTSYYLDLIKHQVSEIFEKSPGAEVIEIPIVLDGGNFVSNGKVGFITDKVIKDNKNISADIINKMLHKYLGVDIIIIPSNKNDKLSHADGYLNFLGENRICISEYPEIDFLSDDIEYLNKIRMVIGRSLEITTIYDRPLAEKVSGSGRNEFDKSKECLNSARGIFINFLILNNTIILPEYTIPNYKRKMIYNEVNKHILQNLGYNVISVNCDELAKLGGSLHCISFTN
jgi:agmatine/peptidylarginine deiminase